MNLHQQLRVRKERIWLKSLRLLTTCTIFVLTDGRMYKQIFLLDTRIRAIWIASQQHGTARLALAAGC